MKNTYDNYQYMLNKARGMLNVLTSKLIYRPQNVKNYSEESIKNGFKELGFDVDIQDKMWNEYCSFLKNHINK